MVKSSQPRFSDKDKTENVSSLFFSSVRSYDKFEEEAPEYTSDSRKRDQWLYDFSFIEPNLAGVVNSVTSIDKNRGWRVVGGRNQVRRITEMLHEFEAAPGLVGWRPALAGASSAFWSTDMGAVVELGREGRQGPVRRLYNVDPLRCQLTGKVDYPLKYYPKRGKLQRWDPDAFFRVSSLPSVKEEFNGLGNSAVGRSVKLGQLMMAVYRHDSEKLMARAPRGLLLLSGIREDQWNAAMSARDTELDAQGMKYFDAVAVLASSAANVDAKMVALSELPTSFNLRDWMDMLMYGYSLCFGYDASEFWPVQYGALGRGNETQIQHEKATGKGRLEFVLGFQEQLQNFLPDSIEFTFDQRDEQGDLLHASVNQAWSNVAKTLYEAGSSSGNPLLSIEESRMLLAEYGIIPSTWAESDIVHSTDQTDPDNDPEVEGSEASGNEGKSDPATSEPSETNPDAASPLAQAAMQRAVHRTARLKRIREQLLQSQAVFRAAEKFPSEPIVQYSYPANTITTLWDSGSDLLKPNYWVGYRVEQDAKGIMMADGQHSPIIINVPETKVEVNVPPNNITVNVPEQRQVAPVVNVHVPDQQAPVVHVHNDSKNRAADNITLSPIINVPPQEITVEVVMPKQKETITIDRDNDGKIKKMTKENK